MGKLSSFSMKTQLLIYTSVILTSFSVLVYFIEYIAVNFILDAFVDLSDQIFDNVSEGSLSYTTSYVNYLNLYFSINSQPLIIFSQLYLAYLNKLGNMQGGQFLFGGSDPIPSCISDSQLSYSTLCYAYKEQLNESDLNQEKQVAFGDFLAPIGQIISANIQNNDPLLYGYLTDFPKLLSSYPCYSYGEKFDEYIPEFRPWYKLAESMVDDTREQINYIYNVSEPYLFTQTKTVGITLVVPQLNEELQFKGAWCADLFLEYIAKRSQEIISDENVRILIVTKEGLVVPAVNSTSLVYFYDQNETGFDEKDWESLQNKSLSYFRFKVDKSVQSVIKVFLEKQQMYILFILDQVKYHDHINEFRANMQNQIRRILQQQVLALGLSSSILLVTSYFVISLFMKPIKDIIYFSQRAKCATMTEKYEHLLKTRYRFRKHCYISPAIRQLQLATYYLQNEDQKQKSSRNSQCQQIQKFQFPKISEIVKKQCQRSLVTECKKSPQLHDLNIKQKSCFVSHSLQLLRKDFQL